MLRYRQTHELEIADDASARFVSSKIEFIPPGTTTPPPVVTPPPTTTPPPVITPPPVTQPPAGGLVFSAVPSTVGKPYLKTFQGFGSVGWQHALDNQFGGDYVAMVNHIGQFAKFNAGSIAGYGTGTGRPWPKSFPGSYLPVSPPFLLAGYNGTQFIGHLRQRNPTIDIYAYTTASWDNVSGPWDAEIGMPPPGSSWYAGNFENLRCSLNAIKAIPGINGVYLDLCAGPYIDSSKHEQSINICKNEYGFKVMLNITYAQVANAKFALGPRVLDNKDLIYIEGFWFDSIIGYTRDISKALAQFMATEPRGIGLAAVIEALEDTPISVMQDYKTPSKEYKDWIDGNGLLDQYAKPTWMREHQRALYDYLAQTIGGA